MVYSILVTACWYLSSSINAIATQKLFQGLLSSPSLQQHGLDNLNDAVNAQAFQQQGVVLMSVVLTLSQLITGGIMGLVLLYLLGGQSTVISPNQQMTRTSTIINHHILEFHTKIQGQDILIGLLHCIGCIFTNIGFGYGSASLVQIIKLLEPVETLFLSALVQKSLQVFSFRKFASTVIVIAGTYMLLAGASIEAKPRSIIFAIGSGFCMALRNVLSKEREKGQLREESIKRVALSYPEGSSQTNFKEVLRKGIKKFAYITITATAFAFILALVVMFCSLQQFKFMVPQLMKISPKILNQAIIFHCLYNMASITVLSLTSAPSHSLLNVGKRIVNVIIASIAFNVALSSSGKVGIFVAGLGAFFYNEKSASMIQKMESSRQKYGFAFVVACLILLQVYEQTHDAAAVPTLPPIVTGTQSCFSAVLKNEIRALSSTENSRNLLRDLKKTSLVESKIMIISDASYENDCALLLPLVIPQECIFRHGNLGNPWKKEPIISWPDMISDAKAILQDYIGHNFSDFSFSPNDNNDNNNNDELGAFLRLIFGALSRSLPQIGGTGSSTKTIKSLASKIGIAYFEKKVTMDKRQEQWKVCGSRPQTRSVIKVLVSNNSDDDDCWLVSGGQPVYDEGLADSNFEAVMKHFTLDRWTLSQLYDSKEIAIRRNSNGTVMVGVSGGPGNSNGGDAFGPVVAKHILGSRGNQTVPVGATDFKKSPVGLAAVGSTVQWLLKKPGIVLWGVGLINDVELGVGKVAAGVEIPSVRGPRTRDIILLYKSLNPLPISDPALIAADVYPLDNLMQQQQQREVCFIIHGVDRAYAFEVCPLCKEHLVNNYNKNMTQMFLNLKSCKRVISSSLHGIVFSHSFGIPALPVAVGDRIMGGDFKYRDYMHSIGMTYFRGRTPIQDVLTQNLTLTDWSKLVDQVPHPKFPIQTSHFYQTFPKLGVPGSLVE
mmetsp:Transcript_32871/g.37402  ORF Transcript_32871/g.37402 Transcript_32871/m.37402 type:complete len:947 (-) Transcript_32871:161-3001(-)